MTKELRLLAPWQKTLKIVHSANREPKVVDIQAAQGATLMPTTHKTYYVKDCLGEIRPIVAKAYVVPVLKYDLLSVNGLNKCRYAVYYHTDPEESGVNAVINKKIDKSKSFPL